MLLAILITTFAQYVLTIPLLKEYVQEKAFEVSYATIDRVADISSFALLERTDENRLNLQESMKKIQKSHINGLLGISIYESQKEQDILTFKYLAGFSCNKNKETINPKELYNHTPDSYDYVCKNHLFHSYRFIKPISYKYNQKNILLGYVILYYDKDAINSVVNRIVDFIFTIAISTLLIATLFVYFTGVKFTSPILQITDAAADVAKGDLTIQLDINTNDEVERLAQQFNKMVNGLQEKEKMQKFVSNSTIDMIQDTKKNKILLGGEYRTLTFMFCDIRGFTELSESKDPSTVVEIINFYLNIQANIIKKNDGDVDKFIGDEVMASFSGEHSVLKAINCSIEIQKKIKEENKKRLKNSKIICEVGIGINQGSVIVGNIGSNDRMDFTSIGHAVNIAARLCSKAKAKQISIEKTTYDNSLLKYDVDVEEPIKVKGVSYALETYSLKYV